VCCAVTIPPADLHSLSLYYYTVCGRMGMLSVIQQFLRIISGVHVFSFLLVLNVKVSVF
jgi:hypothetical protein